MSASEWRRLGPRERPPLHEHVATADVDGEELSLSIEIGRRSWIVRWRGETWQRDGVLAETIDDFLAVARGGDGPGDAKGGDAT